MPVVQTTEEDIGEKPLTKDAPTTEDQDKQTAALPASSSSSSSSDSEEEPTTEVKTTEEDSSEEHLAEEKVPFTQDQENKMETRTFSSASSSSDSEEPKLKKEEQLGVKLASPTQTKDTSKVEGPSTDTFDNQTQTTTDILTQTFKQFDLDFKTVDRDRHQHLEEDLEVLEQAVHKIHSSECNNTPSEVFSSKQDYLQNLDKVKSEVLRGSFPVTTAIKLSAVGESASKLKEAPVQSEIGENPEEMRSRLRLVMDAVKNILEDGSSTDSDLEPIRSERMLLHSLVTNMRTLTEGLDPDGDAGVTREVDDLEQRALSKLLQLDAAEASLFKLETKAADLERQLDAAKERLAAIGPPCLMLEAHDLEKQLKVLTFKINIFSIQNLCDFLPAG